MENDRVIVETHRLFIRVWKEQDQSLLHTIMSDADVMRYVWDYKPPTIGQIQEILEKRSIEEFQYRRAERDT